MFQVLKNPREIQQKHLLREVAGLGDRTHAFIVDFDPEGVLTDGYGGYIDDRFWGGVIREWYPHGIQDSYDDRTSTSHEHAQTTCKRMKTKSPTDPD